MYSLRKPSTDTVDRFVRQHSAGPFNSPTGLTEGTPPRRWFVDEIETIVGVGTEAFEAACAALRRWEHMDLNWFRVHRPNETPMERGAIVAYSTRVLRTWMTFACRIVSVIDEVDRTGTRRFGYVYGTIEPHAAQGEERVLVTLDARTGEVHASIRAVSRPARWFTWLGLPVARRAQRLFKPAALAALAGAVRRQTTGPTR